MRNNKTMTISILTNKQNRIIKKMVKRIGLWQASRALVRIMNKE